MYRYHSGAALSLMLMAACGSPEPPKGETNTASPAPAAAVEASTGAPSASSRLAPVRGIPRPLSAETQGLVMVDRLDIASDPDEAAHQYAISGQTFRGMHDFDQGPNKPSYLEDGRAMKGSETFQIKCLPNQDHTLVKALDTLSKDQKVRVIVGGKNLGEWSVPNGSSGRYAEVSFPIPAAAIGNRTSVDVKLEYVSGAPDSSSLIYWVFSKPSRKLEAPITTNIAGHTLVDKIDVGTEPDEAAHQYVIDQSHYAAVHEFQWPTDAVPFLENGRATRSFESFRVKVKPGVDHLLVKAFDTLSRAQKVRVSVDGSPAGDWDYPDAASRYNEAAISIPAKLIGDRREVTVRVEFLSGSIDTNSFYYWVYAKTGDAAARVALESQPR
jgi:hypothetical protein